MLVHEGVSHGRVHWQPACDAAATVLALGDTQPSTFSAETTRVSRDFMRLASAVACHRDMSRWDTLYRVLWRITHGEPRLLEVATDPDISRLHTLERAVRRAAHKMKAFVRFRAVKSVASALPAAPECISENVAASSDETRYVAWFEPAQNVVERVAPFFARRFASMTWSILTPDCCVHWDRSALHFTPGLPRSAAPRDDALEDLWRTYYAHIFNPARLNLDVMRAEMPKRYWIDLPEARLVRDLAREAPRRVAAMLAQTRAPAEPLPADMQAEGDVGISPDVHGAVAAAPLSARASMRAVHRELEVPGAWDTVHDPGTLVAAYRAAHVSSRAPNGMVIDGARVVVGSAGWTDPTLTSGNVFYPPEANTPEERLRYYASRFSFVEVDATYYALPTRGMATAWAARTPRHFVFDVKAHALMTGHGADVRQLPDWLRRELPSRAAAANPGQDGRSERIYSRDLAPEIVAEVWTRFVDALEPLRASGKLGAVLLQYPKWFRPSRESAAALRAARDRLGDTLGAIEFRNRSWMEGRIGERTLALLRELDLAYVIVDAPPGTESSMPPTVAVTSSRLAVIRLHGRRESTWEARNDPATERYRYLYDRDQLAAWTRQMPDIAKQTQGVHVVCNNCHANYGTTNADEITEMLIDADGVRREMGRANGLRGRLLETA